MRSSKASRRLTLLALFLVLVSVGLLLYPFASNWLAERTQSSVISDYERVLAEKDDAALQEEWDKAVAYNESLAGDPVHDPFLEGSGMALPQDYVDVLNVGGVMGYVDIPKIAVHLPIYHGTDDMTLQRGVGHIRQTALPVGGQGTHSVLTGHTGLPSAKLFTDLDQLQEGDLFVITVLGEKLAYKVDAINVVLPNETELLDPEPGRDFCTLLTCTPYGINSHRLLVRGERTDYNPADEANEGAGALGLGERDRMLLIVAGSVVVAAVVFFGGLAILNTRRKKAEARRISHGPDRWWDDGF